MRFRHRGDPAALERLSERGSRVATFNSDVPGGRRICYVGEDGHRAGRVAGEIASCFLSRGDAFLVIYADPKYTAHKARVDGFLERLAERGIPEENGVIAATHRDYRKTAETVESALAAHPNLRMVYMAKPQRPGLRGSSPEPGPGRKGPHPFPRLRPGDSGAAEKRRGGFTIGQDLAYQPYQALSVLFEALRGQRPDRTPM